MKRYFISWYQRSFTPAPIKKPNVKTVIISVKHQDFVCLCAVVDADSLASAKKDIRGLTNFETSGEFRFYQEKDPNWMPSRLTEEAQTAHQANCRTSPAPAARSREVLNSARLDG